MSYGALSKEAHECVATAMNRLGGMSNTGEGGEDSARFDTETNDRIKQVASARFGVTSDYLIHADELQIKCSQGAKPGEGGHLPGNKVYPDIAKTRHATTGVALISASAASRYYSIEDLAELILTSRMPTARLRFGRQTDVRRRHRHDCRRCRQSQGRTISLSAVTNGGTGASPRTSLRHAGLPWEIGLSEVQQTLLLNRLRDRVTLEVDGKLLTGRDVAIAALFGAESSASVRHRSWPSAAICCASATSTPARTVSARRTKKLRKRFKGKPEYIINFMRFVAQDLREIMARLASIPSTKWSAAMTA